MTTPESGEITGAHITTALEQLKKRVESIERSAADLRALHARLAVTSDALSGTVATNVEID
jgi:hypothetical protein